MTRENKLALIIGFGLILVLGILISDHFSAAHTQETANLLPTDDPLLASVEGTELYEATAPSAGSLRDLRLTPVVPEDRNASSATHRPAVTLEEVPDLFQDDPAPFIEMPRQADLIRIDVEASDPGTPAGTGEHPADSYHWRTVRGGETLTSICKEEYGDTTLLKRLIEFNADRISNPDLVPAGIRIRIPAAKRLLGGEGSPKPQSTGDSRAPRTAASSATDQYDTYVVQKDDILSELSIRFLGTSRRWKELWELNKDVIRDPDRLLEGTKIKVPRKP